MQSRRHYAGAPSGKLDWQGAPQRSAVELRLHQALHSLRASVQPFCVRAGWTER
jgi:hypothetical protein